MDPLALLFRYALLLCFVVCSSATPQRTTTTLSPFLLNYEYFHDWRSQSILKTCRMPLALRKSPLHSLRTRGCDPSLSIAHREMFSLPTHHGPRLICIPRDTCIHHCGAERRSCVYTGDCQFQSCFVQRDGSSAIVFEATHEGPNSIVIPTSGYEGNWSDISVKPSYKVHQSGPSSTHFNRMPTRVMGPSLNHASIRTSTVVHEVCEDDSSQHISTESAPTKAPSDSDTADDTPSGRPPAGDAAQPVSSLPTATPSVEAQEPDSGSNSEKPDSSRQRPNAQQTVSTSSSGLPGTDSNEPATSKENSTVWTWLGPVLGLLGAILAAVAAIAAAVITRKGFWSDFSDNFHVQNRH